jgi:hypothetical protein
MSGTAPNMRIALFKCLILSMFSSCDAFASTAPEELVSEVATAIKSRDPAAFQKCFNLERTEPGAVKAIADIQEKAFTWPTEYVFTTERIDKGPMQGVRDGVPFKLNGEWTFNINMYISKPPSKGLVFPAGFSNGKCLILMAVKEDTK